MSRKLRVFLSSTMKDLVNERIAVRQCLESLNLEPVNAEGWLPTGTDAWSRIAQEIESSDVFILILGERYGWIPTEGPKAGLGLSVTHLEYQEALTYGLPILPFFKKLEYDAERTSDDAKKRDAFRDEVAKWAGGRVVTRFEYANDLGTATKHAVVELLADQFLKPKIRARVSIADRAARSLDLRRAAPAAASSAEPDIRAQLPAQLLAAVASREAVLFAGSGISMSAGLPSASAFAEHLAQVLTLRDTGYVVSSVGATFAAIASDFEAYVSRAELVDEVSKLLDPPQGLRPTSAHTRAVGLFDRILTTNWDSLFESAASAGENPFVFITGEFAGALPDRAIVKLHGSLEEPASLLLTDADVLAMDRRHGQLWKTVRDLIRDRTLVVLGTSLRDPSIIRLLQDSGRRAPGYFVVPSYSAATAARLHAWNLDCVSFDADSFFFALAAGVAGGDAR